MNASIVGTPARRRWTASALLAVFALVGAMFAVNGPAGAADPLIVDIRVELNIIDDDGGEYAPRVFEVTGVEAKAGQIELSEADEISNPEEWCGSVTVDIDPEAGTITIATEEDCDFHIARVIITSDQIDAVEVVSDDLWDADRGGDDADMLPVQITKSGNSTELFWTVDFDETDASSYLKEDGIAVFSFTLVETEPEPTTTTTEAETTTTTAPSDGAPGGATPIRVTPSYTG